MSAAGLADQSGVLLVEVPDGSQAVAAGLREGDVILQLDGRKVHSVRDLQQPSASSAGKTIDVVVYRDQNRLTIRLVR